MKITKNICNIANATLVLLLSVSPIATAMEDSLTSMTPGKLKEKETSGLKDHEYYKAELQKLEESTRRIHEEVDRILKEFRENTKAYYQHTRGTTPITGKKEEPAKDREKEEARKYYELGVQDENEDKIEEAKQNYEIAAIIADLQGRPLAQFALGDIFHEEGEIEQSKDWWEKADAQGSGRAELLQGIISRKVGDIKKAKVWLEKAAVKGSDMAHLILGDIFYREGTIENDSKKTDEAYYWWEKLAKQGGDNNYHGIVQGLINTTNKLMGYIRELLIQGDVLRKEKKIEEAKKLYQQAANLGDDEAKTILENIQKEGK